MKNIYSVIMAGGIGSRFWPVSTAQFPKQFHDILGTGETLLQQTYRRLLKVSSPDKILVVTHKNYHGLVAEQLPHLPTKNIILEPARRNTAPCITYAAYRIASQDPTATMLVAPSDHLIANEDEFTRIALLACREASQSRKLFTLGIKPHRPDTGYGYIQYISLEKEPGSEIKRVKTFTEKPDESLARQFINSGDFLWNSGIFIWSLPTFMAELEEHQQDLYTTFEAGGSQFGTDGEKAFVEKIYPACDNESIDYGLMEKSSHVYVVPSDFGWSDLGTWGSLHEHARHDNDENAVMSDKVMAYDTKNTLIKVSKNKLAIVQGLDGYIVVEEDHALLICKRDHEQLIKSYVNDVKLRFGG
ncbi:MAG: mannose-1-phosphate guanylyltransferase [Owenweeksia sp.]|nr:mannose-1-phosphate guanylyltransferase [Owenweeksia sp.]